METKKLTLGVIQKQQENNLKHEQNLLYLLKKRKETRLYRCSCNQLDDPLPFKIIYTNHYSY